jgi:hypothetical protein
MKGYTPLDKRDQVYLNYMCRDWFTFTDKSLDYFNGMLAKDAFDHADKLKFDEMIKNGLKMALDFIFMVKNRDEKYIARYGHYWGSDLLPPSFVHKVIAEHQATTVTTVNPADAEAKT